MMKKILFVAALCLIGMGSISRVLAQEPSAEPESVNTTEDKVYALSLLWSEIKYNFVHIDHLDFDVDSLYRATMQRVLETKNDREYYKELHRFLRAFNDAHTNLMSYPDSGDDGTDYPKYGTRLFGDKFYFTSYHLNSDTDPRLLGAEIVEIEGIPAMEYAKREVLPNITASTPNYKLQTAAAYLLNGPVNTYIKGKAKTRKGEMIDFNIIRNGETTRTPDDKRWEPKGKQTPSDRRSLIDLTWKGNIAVLAINAFWPEDVMGKIDSVMRDIKVRKPAGLILDLRGNGGGSTEVANHLQMYLTDADSLRGFGTQTRTNLGYGRAQGNWQEEYADYFNYKSYDTEMPEVYARNPAIEPLQCPVVVLMGVYSFSACEDFLVCMSEMPGHPLLIGEESAGSTGSPLVVYLPHEAVARICTLRILYPYSLKPFVGQGVRPDIEVKLTLDDYLNGVDTVMERALKEVRKK